MYEKREIRVAVHKLAFTNANAHRRSRRNGAKMRDGVDGESVAIDVQRGTLEISTITEYRVPAERIRVR